jgi:hypothetical protein
MRILLQGAIYVGVIEAFEELGILPYLKRFAGASAGSCVGKNRNHSLSLFFVHVQPHTYH